LAAYRHLDMASVEGGTERHANHGHPGRRAAPLRQHSERQSGVMPPHSKGAFGARLKNYAALCLPPATAACKQSEINGFRNKRFLRARRPRSISRPSRNKTGIWSQSKKSFSKK
jgi:hypothetical protein